MNSILRVFFTSLIMLFEFGCEKNAAQPVEIVRVPNRGSVMQNLSPVINRGGAGNVLVVSGKITNEQIDEHLLIAGDRKAGLKKEDHVILYISGPKAKRQRNLKMRMVNSRKFRKKPTKLEVKNSGDRVVPESPVLSK